MMTSSIPSMIRKRRAAKARLVSLEHQVAEEKRRVGAAEERLRRVISASATRQFPEDIIRLCVNVDARRVQLRGNSVIEEAARQLMHSLHIELSKR